MLGIKEGELAGEEILTGMPDLEDIDTVTLYVGAKRQPPYYDWLLGLKPRRIISTQEPKTPNWPTLPVSKGSKRYLPVRW